MSNTILLKRNGNAAAVPAAANLTLGELSLNYADGVLYFLNSGNVVTVLANANTAAGTQLVNGTSNVRVASGANVTISSAGTANVLTISSTGTVVSGTQSVTGNITGGNLLTGGLISSTGTITTANAVTVTFTPSTTAGSGITSQGANTQGGIGYYDFLKVTNQSTGATNINKTLRLNTTGSLEIINSAYTQTIFALSDAGNITASGNIQGSYFIGNGAALTGITASGGSSIVNGTSNVVVAASGNVTVGVAGTAAVATFATTGEYVTGVVSASGNITGGNISATNHTGTNVSVTGTVTAASTVGGVITGSSLSTSGNVTTGNILTGGLISATGNITGGNIISPGTSGNITGANVISATTFSATGNVTGGNISTVGLITATGNVYTGNILTNGYYYANGVAFTGGGGGGGNSITNGTSNVVVAASGNISMAVAGANVITIASTGIINNQANGVGNIGSSTTYFNTVFAKATSAQYADLAEMYCADGNYASGTVVEFGGDNEVTATTESHSTRVAGIISTNPSYLMNSTLDCSNALEVALVGRVPCSVVGTIRKGDRLVSSGILGVAQALNMNLYEPGCIVGKALEDYNSAEPGIIEVAVGRA